MMKNILIPVVCLFLFSCGSENRYQKFGEYSILDTKTGVTIHYMAGNSYPKSPDQFIYVNYPAATISRDTILERVVVD